MSDGERVNGTIIVGVDGSASSQRALAWALRQAEATGATVQAVLAWSVPTSYGTGVMVLPGVQWQADAKETLEAAVASASSAYPEVPVQCHTIEGHPATVLLHQAKDADLLVVGSRGHGGFVGALIGSVSHHVIHHAPCPVVIIPDATRKE
jgi:nucleotide-binding universal stress UspA family protein